MFCEDWSKPCDGFQKILVQTTRILGGTRGQPQKHRRTWAPFWRTAGLSAMRACQPADLDFA
eukprot:2814548-Prymnesium_polylepis.1